MYLFNFSTCLDGIVLKLHYSLQVLFISSCRPTRGVSHGGHADSSWTSGETVSAAGLSKQSSPLCQAYKERKKGLFYNFTVCVSVVSWKSMMSFVLPCVHVWSHDIVFDTCIKINHWVGVVWVELVCAHTTVLWYQQLATMGGCGLGGACVCSYDSALVSVFSHCGWVWLSGALWMQQ